MNVFSAFGMLNRTKIMPMHFLPKYYSLKKYPTIQYTSLEQCFQYELPEFYNNKDKHDSYSDVYDIFKEKILDQKLDQTKFLVDVNNKLTNDELFAIFRYTYADWKSPTFYQSLIKQLANGVTGSFNCYFEYLMSGLRKIKTDLTDSQCSTPAANRLYRGTKNQPETTDYSDAYTVGSIVRSNSITSASCSLSGVLSTYSEEGSVVFFINHKQQNSRWIVNLSSLRYEAEYLYFPQTAFEVLNTKTIYCKYSINPSESEGAMCFDSPASNTIKYQLVELDELDENADNYEIIQRPIPLATPTPVPIIKKISKTPSSNQKESFLGIEYDPLFNLGDYSITVAYLGASPIIDYAQPNHIMNKARKVLGHIIPPPNIQHTAIWVGKNDNSDNSIGTTIVYGKYRSVDNDTTFILQDGARAFVSTLKDFKEAFNVFEPKRMKIGRNMTLKPLLDEIRQSGNWSAEDYDWAKNNCQQFTAKCAQILKLQRYEPSSDDWTEVAPSVLNVIESNEVN